MVWWAPIERLYCNLYLLVLRLLRSYQRVRRKLFRRMPLSGAVFKSWYAIPISCVALAFFSNGGDVNLKPGYTLVVTCR